MVVQKSRDMILFSKRSVIKGIRLETLTRLPIVKVSPRPCDSQTLRNLTSPCTDYCETPGSQERKCHSLRWQEEDRVVTSTKEETFYETLTPVTSGLTPSEQEY